jgi:hypothetical protein
MNLGSWNFLPKFFKIIFELVTHKKSSF